MYYHTKPYHIVVLLKLGELSEHIRTQKAISMLSNGTDINKKAQLSLTNCATRKHAKNCSHLT